MDKMQYPRGLIRYDSYNAIAEGKKRRFTPRMAAYSVVLLVLIGLEVFLLNYRVSIETLILRTPGMLYQKVDEDHLSNLYNYEVVNKTNKEYEQIHFKLVDHDGEIKLVGKEPTLGKGAQASGSFFIVLEKDDLHGQKNPIYIEIYADGELIEKVKTNFMGPIK